MAMPGPLGSILDPNYGFNFAPQTPQMQGTVGVSDVQQAQGISGQGVNQLGGLAGAALPYGMVNFGQMQGLGNQLKAESMGQGPNPSMAQLAMTTGQNVANTNALMASQRGTAANTGMLSRQAGYQGAGIQQQAVGQSALMSAQQQLAAQQQLQQQQEMINNATQGAVGNFAQAGQNQYGQLANTYDTQNVANLQAQNNMLNNQYAMEQLRAKTQGQLVGGMFSGFGALGSMGGGMGGSSSGGGGGGSGFGSMAGGMLAAHGGQVPTFDNYAGGGSIPVQSMQQIQSNEPSLVSQHINSQDSDMGWGGGPLSGKASMLLMAKGGRVPAIVSPGEIVLSAQEASDPRRAAIMAKLKAMRGEKVPGKAKVPGDSLKNDTVKTNLEQGGIVVPRTKANSKDAGKFAKAVAMRGRK